jgi:hypothetical protein
VVSAQGGGEGEVAGRGGGGREYGGWAADTWLAHDEKKRGERRGTRLGRHADQSAHERGRREGAAGGGGRAPDGPQEGNAGLRERGEKKKGKRKGFFPILIISSKSMFSQI